MPIRALIIVLVTLAALAGCGRRGDLEAPGATTSTSTAPPSNVSPLDPGSVPATPEQQPIEPPPRRHFILDYLL
jgi:predicted small lipoprotein YifL